MNTTTYERAKAYEHVSQKVKDFFEGKQKMYSDVKQTLEYLFPELAESEDEKIRKDIMSYLQHESQVKRFIGDIEYDKWVAWLEKQSKQKPADKVEPRFKVGDWIVFNNDHDSIYQVEKIENYEYTLRHILGGSMPLSFSHGNMIRAWTIENAKDGDVLYSPDNNLIWIYKDKGRYYACVNMNYATQNVATNELIYIPDDAIPATKEQRDTLFTKMKKAGYEWNAEKLELKKIDSYCRENCKGYQETGKCYADGECKAKGDAENKPTQEIESFEAEHGKYYYCIKDYFCGGRKQASKGDVVQALRGLPIMSLKDASEYFLPVNNVQKPAWSEEDEHRIKDTIYFLDTAKKYYASTVELNACIDWLKSLKPQSHWKPTDEQINLLSEVQEALMGKDCHNRFVNFMYDLKKL